jgi:hypothetical protein
VIGSAVFGSSTALPSTQNYTDKASSDYTNRLTLFSARTLPRLLDAVREIPEEVRAR